MCMHVCMCARVRACNADCIAVNYCRDVQRVIMHARHCNGAQTERGGTGSIGNLAVGQDWTFPQSQRWRLLVARSSVVHLRPAGSRDRHTDIHTDRQADRQTHIQTEIDRMTDRHTHTRTHRELEAHRHIIIMVDRQFTLSCTV